MKFIANAGAGSLAKGMRFNMVIRSNLSICNPNSTYEVTLFSRMSALMQNIHGSMLCGKSA